MFELTGQREAQYQGLRMTADEYLSLPNDGFRYELVDGVVFMSPSASFWHQRIAAEIVTQIRTYLNENPVGEVAFEVDVRLRDDLVYRPDVVFLRSEKAAKCGDAITEIPDLVVEVISPDSRNYDSRTKRQDYQTAGVGEYWLIDPKKQAMSFLVLREGAFQPEATKGNSYSASVLPGFKLDLDRIRRMF